MVTILRLNRLPYGSVAHCRFALDNNVACSGFVPTLPMKASFASEALSLSLIGSGPFGITVFLDDIDGRVLNQVLEDTKYLVFEVLGTD